MPKGTRVHRCVEKLTDRYGYGGAIAICQRSTRQSYMTGKRMTRRKKYRRIYPIVFRGKKRHSQRKHRRRKKKSQRRRKHRSRKRRKR